MFGLRSTTSARGGVDHSPAASSRHWVPASHFVVHSEDVTTTLEFSPRVECRKLDATFFARVALYDGAVAKPALEYVEGPLGMDDVWFVTSGELARRLGKATLFNYLEVHFWSDDAVARTSAVVAESFAHYTSRSGVMEAHLPSAFIYGSGRFTRKTGPMNYQNFPGVDTVDAEVVCYTINPFPRRSTYRVVLVGANGARVSAAPIDMRGKSVSRWTSEGMELSALRSPAGVVIASDVKLTTFVGQLSRHDGRMVGLDHTHPFISI